jgi:hypothetical protein
MEKMSLSRRGVALILSFMVIVVLTILGTATFWRSISEKNSSQTSLASKKAFWAAEAGLARMAAQLPNTTAVSDNNFGGDTKLQYSVPSPTLVAGYSNRWTIISTGTYMLSGEQIPRTITAVAEKPSPNPDLIEKAIETTGSLKITGSVTIEPADSSKALSELSFIEVFGMSKDLVKTAATHTYTDPANDQQPVDGITWVNVTGSNKYVISSSGWSGSGLLVVNGNGEDVALSISGGTFQGVIWVIGKLSISGNPTITGAVFAESDADIENKLSGNATLSFSEIVKDNSFGLLTENAPVNFISWQEQ